MILTTPPSTSTQVDGRWRKANLLVIVLGCALRVAYAFPVHKYAADADCLNPALQALRILDGQWPVFLAAERIGCLVCYETASGSSLFGVSRFALALGPLLGGCLLLVVFSHLLRRVLGGAEATLALLFLALPSPNYIFWTYMPNSYSETMLLCAAALWLTDLVVEKGLGGYRGFALGLVAGLGWWNSPLILAALIPSVIWLFWLRRDLLRQPRLISMTLAGFLIGASPWIAYNLRHSFASFHEEMLAIAGDPRAVLSNIGYLVVHQIPELIASPSPIIVGDSPSMGHRLLHVPVIAIHAAAIMFGIGALIAWGVRVKRPRVGRPLWLLPVLVAPAVFGLYVLSQAGMRRDWNVRYILPSYLSIVVVLALFIVWIGRRHTAAAVFLSGMVLVFNVSDYALWWTPLRIGWRSDLEADRSLMTFLWSNRIQAVCGNYWLTYPINFLSHDEILGIPENLAVDVYGYAHRLGQQPLRWALISSTDWRIHAWAARAKLTGVFAHPAPRYFLFIPDETVSRENPWRFLERLVIALPQRAKPPNPASAPSIRGEGPRKTWTSLAAVGGLVPVSD